LPGVLEDARGRGVEDMSAEQDEIDAIARLARSSDGPLIRRYFRRQLESCRLTDDAGALQRHEGARILARDFLIHMDHGLETPHAGTGNADDAILRASERHAYIDPRRGIKRRVSADPSVTDFLRGASSGPDAA
jgi:hypothetical protein